MPSELGMRSVLALVGGMALLAACGPSGQNPPPDEDDGWQYRPPEFPIWEYQNSVAPGVGTLRTLDGTPAVQVQGYTWQSNFLGPTLVAEQDQEIWFDFRNRTSQPLELAFEGVEIVDVFPAQPGESFKYQKIRTTPGPGVWFYRAHSPDDRLAREGILGLLTVRDTCEIEPRSITQQANLILLDTWVDSTQTNLCSLAVEDPEDDAADDEVACPEWHPSVQGTTTGLVAQRVNVNDAWSLDQAPPSEADCGDDATFRGWKPTPLERVDPERGEPRHGGPPNEFHTITTLNPALELKAGHNTRLNFGSASDVPHTLHLGGLVWNDPFTGAERDSIYLEPNQGGYALLPEIDQVGEYVVRCIDHDHEGPAQVRIVVQ